MGHIGHYWYSPPPVLVVQTTRFFKGNRAFTDLRYGEKKRHQS